MRLLEVMRKREGGGGRGRLRLERQMEEFRDVLD